MGAYILEEGSATPDVIIVATGSEVALVLKSLPEIKAAGITARVVSMPSWKLFEEQSEEYKESIFPLETPKLAVEAGATLGWWKYVGRRGAVIGLDRFGASAPGPIAMDKLGFNATNIIEHAKKTIAAMKS